MKAVFPVLAMILLLGSGCSGVTNADLEALESSNAILRKDAVIKIGEGRGLRIPFLDGVSGRGNERKASKIMAAALRDGKESHEMQLDMLEALAALDGYAAAPISVVLSKLNGEDPDMQEHAIHVLAKMKREEATPALIRLLEAKENPYSVIWALGEIGDHRSIDVLNRLLAHDDQYVRYNAYEALAKIGPPKKAAAPSLNAKKDFLLTFGRAPFYIYQKAMTNLFIWLGDIKGT